MTPEKQKQILSWLLADRILWIKSIPFLKEEYFTDPDVSKVIGAMRKFTIENKQIPTEDIIYAEVGFRPSEKFNSAIPSSIEKEYIVKELEEFYKHSRLHEFLIEGVDMLEMNEINYGELESQMKEIVRASMKVDIGLRYFNNISERLEKLDAPSYYISTGFDSLDKMMNGGWEPSELHIIAGGTGAGKSIFLANHASRNALQGKEVLIITLELAQDIFGLRFDGIFLDKVRDHIMQDKIRTQHTLRSLQEATGGGLTIKYFPTSSLSTVMIEAYLEQYFLELGKYPDIIYLDYMSLMKPNETLRDYNSYTAESLISKELRGLAGELEIPLVTASQLNRSGIDSAVPDKKDIADSIGKIFTVGSLLNISQTKAEKALGLTKLYAAKMRNGPDGWCAKFKINYETLKLTDMDVVMNYGIDNSQEQTKTLQQGLSGIT